MIDRSEYFLKGRGNQISCLQIEERLLEFYELVETVMIGIPDDVLGEAAQPFFVPRIRGSSGLTERVTSLRNSRLASHRIISRNRMSSYRLCPEQCGHFYETRSPGSSPLLRTHCSGS
jgi:non-ribosomal peptide synthetase component E (peptide arylation enzyme)